MLAKSLKYLFTILSAAYFLLVGTGYNVVNYCCQTCANEGIEAVATSSCNAVHHHSHSSHRQQQNSDITCSDVNHNPAGCHLLRLIIDTPFIHTTQKLPVNTHRQFVLYLRKFIEWNPQIYGFKRYSSSQRLFLFIWTRNNYSPFRFFNLIYWILIS